MIDIFICEKRLLLVEVEQAQPKCAVPVLPGTLRTSKNTPQAVSGKLATATRAGRQCMTNTYPRLLSNSRWICSGAHAHSDGAPAAERPLAGSFKHLECCTDVWELWLACGIAVWAAFACRNMCSARTSGPSHVCARGIHTCDPHPVSCEAT